MELSWSQTPSTVWWALENSSSSISVENMLSPPSPTRDRSGTLSRDKREAATIFYNYAPDEVDLGETEDDIKRWIKGDRARGAIRVYQPGLSYSELVKCTIETTAEAIMARFFTKELYIHYGNKIVRRVRLDEHPLQLLVRFLQEIGHSNPQRLQVEGMNEDLAPLFKFVAGHEHGKRPEDSVQLACCLKVKEVTGRGVAIWNRRFCVLCGSRMFIFPSSQPKGKPNLAIDLRGGKISEYKSRRHIFCLRIMSLGREMLLSFESRFEQSKWLERAGNVVTKHPLEANLTGHSLERLPKYYFLNYNLVAMNLAHNFMIESFEHTDAALLGQPRTIGWIEDLGIFQSLVSISLSDNCLDQFPSSLCRISGLKELDLSCNAIKMIPQEIKCLAGLTTLLLHSNQLNTLPYQLQELKSLTTLVLAFNRFFELPTIVMELPSLAILVASGNYISQIPEDINRIQTLVHLDVRLNRIKHPLPSAMEGLRSLLRLNVSGNSISELVTQQVPCLETVNCSGNTLRKLSVNEGPIKVLLAKNNKITQFSVAMTCDNLTSIDISKNELTVLPESLAQLSALHKLNASNNKLTKLPAGLFKMKNLAVIRMSSNHLVSLPPDFGDNCQVKHLDLHVNQLSSLPDNLFHKARRLQTLNVSSNKLTSLPASSSEPGRDISSITELLAANNSLKDSALPVISSFCRIRILHLAYNEMRIIPPGFFSKLNQLTYFNLSGNSFASLPTISGCPLLKTLLLHSNQLSGLPNVLVFPHLQYLDLSCNQFETLPNLASFPRLQQLDLSGNTSLSIDMATAKELNRIGSCCLEGVLDIKGSTKSQRNTVEIGGTTTHGKWSYGSATIIGVESSVNSTVQIKSASLSSRKQDAVFAVLDGGQSLEAPKLLRPIIPSVMVSEMRKEEGLLSEGVQLQDSLQYLAGTFLTAHRRLGEVATEYGCSAILSHIHVLKDGTYVLNVANTGLGEAILCRSGRAVPLTTPHDPSTNSRERTRIADTRGFVSQDGRVNGVCSASRLLGCYYMWPQVIPAPSTESVELRIEDEYIVMGTDSLWKHMTYEQIIHNVRSIADPIRASKRIRDLAVAHGGTSNVSVIVVKLNIDRGPLTHNVLDLKKLTSVDASDSSEEETDEEEEGVTNIDDIISDSEGENDDAPQTQAQVTELASGYDGNIDQMILDAIRSPPTASTLPTVHSTNFDDLPLTDESMSTPSPPITDSTAQDLPKLVQQQKDILSQLEEMSYAAQTLPKDNSKSRKSSKGSTGHGIGIAETNFETTQSDPALKPVNGVRQHTLPVKEKFDHVNDRLAALNRALARMEEEEGPDYSMESIERPRKRNEIKKRLSYVEHSYNKLTNDTYTSDSIHGTRNTVHLDDWGQ